MRRSRLDYRLLCGVALGVGAVAGMLAFGWREFLFGLMAILAALLVLKAGSIALAVGLRLVP